MNKHLKKKHNIQNLNLQYTPSKCVPLIEPNENKIQPVVNKTDSFSKVYTSVSLAVEADENGHGELVLTLF